MKRFFIALVLILVIAIPVWLGYYLYSQNQKAPETFKTTQMFKTNIVLKTVANGSIEPRKEVALKPQISGIIDTLYVEPGQMVEKGDKIARIKVIPDDLSLNSAETSVNKTKLALQQAKTEFDRYQKLFEAGAISETEYNQYKFQYDQSREDYENAVNNYRLIKEGLSNRSSETTTIITSTISGMILDVPVKEGYQVIQSNNFNDGTTVASVADMNDLLFVGNVDESEVGKIKEGMPIQITIGAIEDKKFDAKLEYISPKGAEDQGTIQFEIKAAVTQPDSFFVRAGYSANADIILDKRDSVWALMERDLHFYDDSITVEVETGDQLFEERRVYTGLSDGVNMEIMNGIDSTTKVKVQK